MLRTVVCFIPFMVCLFWFLVFVLKYRRHNPAKKVHTWFLLVCSVLYLCHALFFSSIVHHTLECIWALCSLSVYPIYYLYIRALTGVVPDDSQKILLLLPGLIVSAVMFLWPGRAADYLRLFIFTIQIVFVCWAGIQKLKAFDSEVASCYADADEFKTTDVRALLRALVLMSCLSIIANALGKSTFAGNDALLIPVALLFASLLFALGYLGYTRELSYKEFAEDIPSDVCDHTPNMQFENLVRGLDKLMKEDKLFKENNLKITDVAGRLNSCRTYVSNCINQSKGETFSDYVNRLRIEEATAILSAERDIKNIVLAELVGFTNEQSFYRNFKKFTGMTPTEWKKANCTI